MTARLPRRPQEAMTREEVLQYFTTRARQLWHEGWRWDQNLEDMGEGFRTEFRSATGQRYASYYILAQYHGQGHYRRLAAAEALPIVTITDCHIEQMLEHLKVPYVRAGELLDTAEYRLVEAVLGDDREPDGSAFRMNRIDEGLAVLTHLGASGLAMRAFCLVPLVQGDAELSKYFDAISGALDGIAGAPATLALALEYRNTANRWLPDGEDIFAGPRASPLKDVNDILIADHVQRRKVLEDLPEGLRDPALARFHLRWLNALEATRRYPALREMLPTF